MGLTPVEVTRTLWANYEYHKGRLRKHEQKPVRKVRRFIRKVFKTKGKGKGKGKRPQRLHGSALTAYVASFTDEEYELCFFGKKGNGKGRGAGKGKRSSGKGFGRKQNPIGKDGKR